MSVMSRLAHEQTETGDSGMWECEYDHEKSKWEASIEAQIEAEKHDDIISELRRLDSEREQLLKKLEGLYKLEMLACYNDEMPF
jgi:hypothetical protein